MASSLLVPGKQEEGPRPHLRLWPTAFMCPHSNDSGLRSPELDTSHLAAGPRHTSCLGPLSPHEPVPISVLPACCSQVERMN